MVNSLTSTEKKVDDVEQRRIDFNFPILTVRTNWFGGVFDRLGAFRVSRWASWFSLFVVPIVAGLGLYLLCAGLLGFLLNPAAGDVIREVGPSLYLFLPGINPVLPFLYGWFGFICAIAVHEGAHGVAARSLGLKVKSSGLLFFLFVPFGAFVDVDEKQLMKARPRVSSRALAAGVGGNIAVAAVCLIGALLIVGGLSPVVDGVYVNEVMQGGPAEAAGLLPKDVLITVDNVRINRTIDLITVLDNRASGDLVQVTVARGENWQSQFSTVVNLTRSGNRTVMNVTVSDLMFEERLAFYQNVTLDRLSFYLVPPAFVPDFVPFSDSLASYYTHWLGSEWHVFANVLYWSWWVNVNVAVFNALPIYPLDGGRIFNVGLKRLLRRKEHEKLISTITMIVTAAVVLVLLLTFIIPFAI